MSVVCVRRVVAVVVMLLGSVADVAAQGTPTALAALTPGTLVRARSTDVQVPLRGVVVAIDETTLTLAPDGGLPLKVALQSIVAMDVSLGQRRNTLKGLAIGVLAGVALGYAFPVDQQTCREPGAAAFCSRGDAIGGSTIVFGGLGAIMGALIKTDRWAPLNLRLGSVDSARPSGIYGELALRF